MPGEPLEPDDFHTPVMVAEAIGFLRLEPGDCCLDATEGGGGHSKAIAEKISPGGVLIGIDRDAEALRTAEIRLKPYRDRCRVALIHGEFGDLAAIMSRTAGEAAKLNGCLFDLGTSSFQLNLAAGFSFRRDDPLDSRMDRQGSGPTVAEILAEIEEHKLASILRDNAQERYAARVAHRIVALRSAGKPIETTAQLVRAVEEAIPRRFWPKEIHVATRVFMALRMEANQEIDQLKRGLEAAIDLLAPGGRVVVICYHSVEQQVVKSIFARRAGREPGPSGMSLAALKPNPDSAKPDLEIITRKPLGPTEAEVRSNTRARSAQMRVAQKSL